MYLRNCRDGGYFEVHELDMNVKSQDDMVAPDIQEWCRLMRNGMECFGKSLDLGSIDIVGLMDQAGFTDIVCKLIEIPIGTWPKDNQLKWAGYQQLDAMLDGIRSLAVLSKARYWDPGELEVFLAGVRRSLTNNEHHLYIPG